VQLSRDPLRGHLVENFVILELMKWRFNHGLDPQLYYYRDAQKNEVDVVFKEGHNLIPIEIKSSKTYNSAFLKNLLFFQKIAKDRAPRAYLVYTGEQQQKIQSIELINYKKVITAISPNG